LDEPAYGILRPWSRTDQWKLVLSTAGDYRVELTNLPLDYDLYVTWPDGRRDSSTRGGVIDDVVSMMGAPAGTYNIEVVPGDEVISGDTYQLAARRGLGPSTAPPGSLALDQPVSSALTDRNRSHRYEVSLPVASEFRIVELTNLQADYDLYVTSPTGKRTASVRSGWDDEATPIGGAAGTYVIEVRASPGASSAPYRLLMRRARSGDVLVADDFSDVGRAVLPTSSSVSEYTMGYERDEYSIRTMDPTYNFLPAAYVPGTFRDASIAVDARVFGQTASRHISLGCRGQTGRAGSAEYRFSIDPGQGTFLLARWDAGAEVWLAEQSSASIRRGNEMNRLELSCFGTTITARINGTQVASVEDDRYSEGQLWIGASTYAGTHLTSEARFKNLVVTQQE
jgi:hypothetical protein